MSKKKSARPKGQAPSANNGSRPQTRGNAAISKEQVDTKVAQLEVPEGYRPQKGTKKTRRRGKKPTNTEAEEPTASTNTMSSHEFPSGCGDGLDLTPTPPQHLLRFSTDRVWISLQNPDEYLRTYADYQATKYDPPVFADEPADDPNTQELQRRRRLYYDTQGRLDRLEVLYNVKEWPNKFGIPTRAPFITCSEHNRIEHVENQELPIFKVLALPEIATTILGHCAPHFQDIANFGHTCWTAFHAVQGNIEHWNMTNHDFLQQNKLSIAGKPRPTPRIVVVSQIRPEMAEADTTRRDSNYFNEFTGLVELFRALKNRAATIMNLQLHRIPFLDLHAVKCIVASLPNLENLGIYQCPLLHVATTGKLLEAIETNKKKSGFVHLDFFPTFHQGPNTSARLGSFGVTWANPGMNTTAGILKLVLYDYYPKARSLGFDLFATGSAFRLWLEKCPLPDWTVVRTNEAVKTYEAKRRTRGFGDHWMADLTDPAFHRLADELAAAMFTDDTEPSAVPQSVLSYLHPQRSVGRQYRKYGWWRRLFHCDQCRNTGPGILLQFSPFSDTILCYGCRLSNSLWKQDDHMKKWQAHAMKSWLGWDAQYPTLAAALDTTTRWNGQHYATRADTACAWDRKNDHAMDKPDLLWRIDYSDLERRYRRDREPHGGIDRRRQERQYIPLGQENPTVTNNLMDECYMFHYLFVEEMEHKMVPLLEKKEGWRYDPKTFRDDLFHAQYADAARKMQTIAPSALDANLETQRVQDQQGLAIAHSRWKSLVRKPNRTAQNWDEMRDRIMDDIERTANGGQLLGPATVDPQWTVTAWG